MAGPSKKSWSFVTIALVAMVAFAFFYSHPSSTSSTSSKTRSSGSSSSTPTRRTASSSLTWNSPSSSSSGTAGDSSTGAPCNNPILRRGQYTKEWAADIVKDYLGTPGESSGIPRVSTISSTCPRFVFAFQNHQAGFGHRMTNWAMALHTAIVLNMTFAHTSFDGGGGRHGNYDGWDKWLSFTKGESGLDDVMARPGIKKAELPSIGGYYGYNEAIIRNWNSVVNGENSPCNVIYQIPNDQWMYDISSTTRAIMALKYAEQVTQPPNGELMTKAGEKWEEKDVNIAVHVRFGDQYPTNEKVHAEIIRGTIIPALRDAGITSRVSVHVFAEDKQGPEFLPFLDSLSQLEPPSAGDGNAGHPIRVLFYPQADPKTSFYYLTQSDFLVMSFSSFSWAAAQVSLRPLALAQPSSDIMKMCAEASVCCDHNGQCGFVARVRVKETALRLAAREASCGGLA